MSENEDDVLEGEEKAPEAQRASRAGAVLFKDRIEIYPDKPLPAYNAAENKAYSAVFLKKSAGPLFALVCERHQVPRLNAVSKYSKISNVNLVTLVASGIVDWPPAGQERYVFLYVNNLNAPLLEERADVALGWKSDVAFELVAKPLIRVLQDFRDRDFVHGAVRPTNMFGLVGNAGGGAGLKSVILGDCLSASASSTQPCLYEPIERAMADPVGRGLGARADDLYALGVSLAVIMRASDPLQGLSDEEIICKKIELGTYAALIGKDRFKGEVLELLRGLLHDDPTQRWTIDEVLLWLDGRRLSPKQALIRKKGARPLSFLSEKFYFLPTLAMSLDKNTTETKRLIDDGSLVQWLKRSVDDTDMIERVDLAVEKAKEGGGGTSYQERLVTHLSAALDSFAPLRFRGLSLMGHGVGEALVEAVVLKKDIKVFADIISYNLVVAWLELQDNTNLDVSDLFVKFERCRHSIRSAKMGEGIERCLYLLCPESPCLSEKLDSYLATEGGEVLTAFEGICKEGDISASFIDRHIAAFLLVSNSKVIETCIFDLNSDEKPRIVLANLRCLGAIQKHYNIGAVPHVARVFAGQLDCVYETYHDVQTREKLKKEIDKLASGGDLKKMVALLTNKELLDKDNRQFKFACREYKMLRGEGEALSERLDNRARFGFKTGQRLVAIVSSFLAVIVVLGAALSLFSGRSFF